MKIAQIAPIIERVPPKTYGGTERVVSALTEELVRRGHDVTLFASSDSITSAHLSSVSTQSLRQAGINGEEGIIWNLLHIGSAYEQAEAYDIIHDHSGILSLPLAQISPTPVVVTIHGSLFHHSRRVYERFQRPEFVSISRSQQKHAPNLKFFASIHNGLPMEHYPYSPSHDDYLLFVGRICPEKGVDVAIHVAKKMRKKLIIAAKVDERNKAYFTQEIEPNLTGDVQWIGEVSERARNELMSRALCFLHPARWDEPFGLTLIEALACGCPVIAFNKGAIPEIIIDGETGFIVENVDQMVQAVRDVERINRDVCRLYAVTTFNDRIMTDQYESVYHYSLAKEEERIADVIDPLGNGSEGKKTVFLRG
jgi:glycosyltransferase involved in cell wall biosynthesis